MISFIGIFNTILSVYIIVTSTLRIYMIISILCVSRWLSPAYSVYMICLLSLLFYKPFERSK